MGWTLLVVAGLFEIVWAVGLKYTEGFSRLLPSVLTLAAMGVSIVLLSFALQTIAIGNAYAVWTGIGTVGVAIIGIVWFNDPVSLVRIGCIALIVTGILGLKAGV